MPPTLADGFTMVMVMVCFSPGESLRDATSVAVVAAGS